MALTISAYSLYRGEDKNIDMTLNPAVDITGWTIYFTVARAKNSTTKLIEILCIELNAPGGEFQAYLPSAQTATFAPGVYYFDAWRTDLTTETLLGIGTLTVVADVRYPV